MEEMSVRNKRASSTKSQDSDQLMPPNKLTSADRTASNTKEKFRSHTHNLLEPQDGAKVQNKSLPLKLVTSERQRMRSSHHNEENNQKRSEILGACGVCDEVFGPNEARYCKFCGHCVHESCYTERDVYRLWQHHCDDCGSFPNHTLKTNIKYQRNIQPNSMMDNLRKWVNTVNTKRENNIKLARAQCSKTQTSSSDAEPSRSSKRTRTSLNDEKEHGKSAPTICTSSGYVQVIADYIHDLNSNVPFLDDSWDDDDFDEDSIHVEALFNVGDPVTLGSRGAIFSNINGTPRYVIIARAYHCVKKEVISEGEATFEKSRAWHYRVERSLQEGDGPDVPCWFPEGVILFKAESDDEDSSDENLDSCDEDNLEDSEEDSQTDSGEDDAKDGARY